MTACGCQILYYHDINVRPSYDVVYVYYSRVLDDNIFLYDTDMFLSENKELLRKLRLMMVCMAWGICLKSADRLFIHVCKDGITNEI